MVGMSQAVVVAAVVVEEGGKPRTVGSYKRSWEAEAEVHPHSIPEMAVVDVRTVVEMGILQAEVEKEGAGTKVASLGEVGIQVYT